MIFTVGIATLSKGKPLEKHVEKRRFNSLKGKPTSVSHSEAWQAILRPIPLEEDDDSIRPDGRCSSLCGCEACDAHATQSL